MEEVSASIQGYQMVSRGIEPEPQFPGSEFEFVKVFFNDLPPHRAEPPSNEWSRSVRLYRHQSGTMVVAKTQIRQKVSELEAFRKVGKHPGVIGFYEVRDRYPNEYFRTIFLEFGNGGSWRELAKFAVERNLTLPLEFLYSSVVSILNAFLFMFAKGLIHRDLHDMNLVLCFDETKPESYPAVKIIDLEHCDIDRGYEVEDYFEALETFSLDLIKRWGKSKCNPSYANLHVPYDLWRFLKALRSQSISRQELEDIYLPYFRDSLELVGQRPMVGWMKAYFYEKALESVNTTKGSEVGVIPGSLRRKSCPP